MKEQWRDNLIIVETIHGLTKRGVLCPTRTFAAPMKPNLKGIRCVGGDFVQDDLSDRMQDRTLIADAVETWLSKAAGRKTLAFCVDRNHARTLQEQYESAGVRCGYIDAFTERDERAVITGQLQRGELKIVTSIGTMTTGVDLPFVDCIQYLRPTRSPILFVQSLARGIRSFPGKVDCLLLDHSSTTERLGLIADIYEDFDKLQPGKKPDDKEVVTRVALPRVCPRCNHVVPPKERRCLNCGEEAAFKSGIRYGDGELQEIGAESPIDQAKRANKEWTKDEKREFFGELKHYRNHEHPEWKEGWSSRKYRDRFGVWPNAYKHAPEVAPSYETLLWIRRQTTLFMDSEEGKRWRANNPGKW
jgi:hypothetical protein